MAWNLRLLGCWQLSWDGVPQRVGVRQQKLIAALALLGSRPRGFLAGLLWPDSTEERAAGSLRIAVYKIRHQLRGLLTEDAEPLRLDEQVAVDVVALQGGVDAIRVGREVGAGLVDMLYAAELLPGWYDDWLLFEQERLRQLRISALEGLARRHLGDGRPDAAVIAAMHAAAIEPLRESASALVIRGQLGSGNAAGARRTLDEFRRRLAAEVGLAPSPGLERLVVRDHPTDHRRPAGTSARAALGGTLRPSRDVDSAG